MDYAKIQYFIIFSYICMYYDHILIKSSDNEKNCNVRHGGGNAAASDISGKEEIRSPE